MSAQTRQRRHKTRWWVRVMYRLVWICQDVGDWLETHADRRNPMPYPDPWEGEPEDPALAGMMLANRDAPRTIRLAPKCSPGLGNYCQTCGGAAGNHP